MRVKFSALSVLLLLLFSCQSGPEKYPDKLTSIPDGITVKHSKEYVYAEPNMEDPERYGKYKWHFTTSVSSQKGDLQVIEFGAYFWEDEQWKFTSIYDRPYNAEEFERWYSCPNGMLISGKTYTDPNNWSKGNNLDGSKQLALWYVIAEDQNGEKYKGAAEVTNVYSLE
ncbi:hypothetical protein K6119_09575 [Paracrocinitomix mangrovi]|uniref:hypothetical protein n=1 Tax=Paracrocinitomix mangrovi TaxID=2862509 RepID=UPI001C8F1B56|nr:hypothetical protein [Paracrocinitomix mangrovi]UKN03740.1 hypothetical protein K6119_09575 [Paracrocinitomix mangrovi]